MARHNRDRGNSRSNQEGIYRSENPRHPGAGIGEFSQLGGPHPAAYREWVTGNSGWNPAGQRSTGGYNDHDRGYSQEFGGQEGHGYREQPRGDYLGRGVYRQGAAWDEDNQRPEEQYGGERAGYPDYSGSQGRGWEGEYNYASQDRGNMEAPMDRDWGQYGGRAGYRGRPGGFGQGGGYGSSIYGGTQHRPSTMGQGGYGTPSGYGYQEGYGQRRYGSSSGQTGYGAGQGGQTGGSTGQGGYSGASFGYSQREHDSRQSGGMHARRQGPKGYQRPDERLREQVIEKLMQETDANIDLQDIEVDVKDGVVILSGAVDSRACRHELEDVADSVWGVKEVTNNLRVKSGSEPSSQSSMQSGNRSGSERSGSTSPTNGSSAGSQPNRNR